MQNKMKVELSPKSVVLAFLVILGFFVAWELRLVFFMFFIAYILSSAFRDYVDKLVSIKVPRGIAIALIYLLVFVVLGLFVGTIIGEAWTQLTNLISQIPNLVYSILTSLTLPAELQFLDPNVVQDSLKELVSSLLKVDGSMFASGLSGALGILSFASSFSIAFGMIIILSIYLLSRKEDILLGATVFVPNDQKKRYLGLFKSISEKLGKWFRAQILLMSLAGFAAWLGLTIPALFIPNYTLHNYALPIAMLVFILEIIPGTGLSVGAILSFLIALATQQTFMIVYAPVLFIGLQQLEGNLVVPKLMKKVIGLDPIITILSLVSGFILFQVMGAILIVPIVAVIQIIIEFYKEDIKAQIN